MQIYCQRDKRWAGIKLGNCQSTIGDYGCALCCVSMLCDKTPNKVNNILRANAGYVKGCLMNWGRAASLFGLKYNSVTSRPIKYPTIAEVDFNPKTKTKEQHFVIVLDENTMIDPWTGYQSQYIYKIISYRNLTPVQTGGSMAKIEFYKLSSGSNTIFGYWRGNRYAYTFWEDYKADGGAQDQSNVKIVNKLPETELDRLYKKFDQTMVSFNEKYNRLNNQILELQKELSVQKTMYEGQIKELKEGNLVKVNWVDTFKAMIRDFIIWIEAIKQKVNKKE